LVDFIRYHYSPILSHKLFIKNSLWEIWRWLQQVFSAEITRHKIRWQTVLNTVFLFSSPTEEEGKGVKYRNRV